MAQQRQYRLKETVWAKVESSPWWPGKITGVLTQNKKKVYKVNFFGDPTYCHLFDSAVSPFSQEPPCYEQFRLTDLKLRKAIEMAKKNILKSAARVMESDDEDVNQVEKIIQQPSAFEQTKLQSKHEIEISQKMLDNEQTFQRENELLQIEQLVQAEVNQDNIIEVLNSKMVSKLTHQKGYSERKSANMLIQKLKNTLLQKYQLDNLEAYAQTVKRSVLVDLPQNTQQKEIKNVQHPIHFNRLHRIQKLKKIKKCKKNNEFGLKCLCIRKVHSVLKRRSLGNTEAQRISIGLVEHLVSLSRQESRCSKPNSQLGKDMIIFKQHFVQLMNWLKSSLQKIKDESLEDLEQIYTGVYMHSKNDQTRIDEEKSKTTSIPGMEY